MKIINIIILYLLINISSSYEFCKSCVPKGQKCKTLVNDGFSPYYTQIGSCEGGFVCAPLSTNLNISESEYVCRSKVGVNGHCLNNNKEIYDICEIGLLCDKSTGECLNSRFVSVGEACTSKTDCEVDSTCISGICTFESANCTYDRNCPYSEYCNDITGKCEARVGEGKSCIDSYSCSNFLQCDVISKTCIKMGSLKLGSKCDGELSCSFDDNLYCSEKSNVCEKYDIPIPEGSCNTTKDYCGSDGQCYCPDSKCYQSRFLPSDLNSIMSLNDCMIKNKCSYVDNMWSRDSCISKHCGPQACEYRRKLGSDFIDEKCSAGNSDADQYCKYTSFSLSKFNFSIIFIFTISSILIMVL